MRPGQAVDGFDSRSRKPPTAPSQSGDTPTLPPTTFFLARESDLYDTSEGKRRHSPAKSSPVASLREIVDDLGQASEWTEGRDNEQPASVNARRRSTIKASEHTSRRESSAHSVKPSTARADAVPLTPLLLPSQATSLSGSPQSNMSPVLHRSDEESMSDEASSQAIASSDCEEPELPSALQDSAPQLIMPSIKMPSRRPFTQRGKAMGRFKILVAGCTGTGKSSLIKSIVQLCEDIVHVDPISSQIPFADEARTSSSSPRPSQQTLTEVFASTKPYPSWWSDVDESKVLRRRKSMGDSVLERNVCFVEAHSTSKVDSIIRYLEQQLQSAIFSSYASNNDLSALLSGRGGSQVDIIIYLVSKDTLQADCDRIRRLTEMANVVPVISKADLLTNEDISELKSAADTLNSALTTLPAFEIAGLGPTVERAQPPYSVSCATGPDMENMDASLLMSPEYVQPLLPSELGVLVDQIFDLNVISYLRHTAAKKIVTWHTLHPQLTRAPSPSCRSDRESTLDSPMPTSLSNSGVLIPLGSELSLTTSNSYALARVADHTQREERFAQMRLSKWASDLQISLHRERERYEKLARGERAVWLVERMGDEIREGHILPPPPSGVHSSGALVRFGEKGGWGGIDSASYTIHDPLGLARWQDAMRTRGWIALQVVGSFGVVGGLALWLAKTCGLGSSMHDWAQEWGGHWFGVGE